MCQRLWNDSPSMILAKLGFVQQGQDRVNFSKVYVYQGSQNSRVWSLIVESSCLSGGIVCRAVLLANEFIPLTLVDPDANVIVLLPAFWLNGTGRSL